MQKQKENYMCETVKNIVQQGYIEKVEKITEPKLCWK